MATTLHKDFYLNKNLYGVFSCSKYIFYGTTKA